MIQRLPCKTCGELIHPDTAAKNNGLCMPCKGGYRANIEASKRRREEDRLHEKSAERQHWLQLVRRVHETQEGFQKLSPPEKTYFAVSCLIGEVYNGGFDQFFSNSSGALYAHALDGLLEMQAEECAAQLAKAKQLLFGESVIPLDQVKRNAKMRQEASNPELDALDKRFWADPEGLGERCMQFAKAHSLYQDG
ncbi:hypothetical protein os4_10010 [Comamonadaceae bacterium OS-4]|nr:hypothetical protein os4_10010 [Comamonadaceae bacterium OS-4]